MWRLLLIIFGTLIFSIFLWFAFYMWGFSRPIFKYENAFMPDSKIFVRSNSPSEHLKPGDGLFIDIGMDLETLYCNGVPCSDLLQKTTSDRLLIRLNINKTDIHTQFLTVFESLKARKDVGFISRYPIVVSSIKEQVPGWSYGASEVEQSKLKIFESLGLVHLPDLKSDFWVTSLKDNKNRFLTPEIAQEMKRRGRAIILEMVESMGDAELAIGLGADAVIVESYLRDGLKSNL
jgi:hypothetical protein